MEIKKITLKQAEQAVKKHSFKIDKKHGHYDKKTIKKANKFEKKHGFRYEDAWDLDNAIACFILPRLIQLRDTRRGYPASFIKDLSGNPTKEQDEIADKEWNNILNKIIYAFYIYITIEFYKVDKEKTEIVEEGLDLFRKYFSSFWD